MPRFTSVTTHRTEGPFLNTSMNTVDEALASSSPSTVLAAAWDALDFGARVADAVTWDGTGDELLALTAAQACSAARSLLPLPEHGRPIPLEASEIPAGPGGPPPTPTSWTERTEHSPTSPGRTPSWARPPSTQPRPRGHWPPYGGSSGDAGGTLRHRRGPAPDGGCDPPHRTVRPPLLTSTGFSPPSPSPWGRATGTPLSHP
jgi:hypothetical protein